MTSQGIYDTTQNKLFESISVTHMVQSLYDIPIWLMGRELGID